MKFDEVYLKAGDVIMVKVDIGNLPSNEVDAYVNKILPKLRDVFGCEVVILPIRGGEWDFTIIRNADKLLQVNLEKKPIKQHSKKLKKVA